MKVIVLGSGVIGTSVAYYLAKSGHQVEVIDRQAGPALETSFANAGEVSPGYSSPWAGPGVPIKAIKWLLMRHSPLVIWPVLDPNMWRWGLSMLANCTEKAYAINKSRMVPIAEYSRDCLKELRAETGIGYDDRAQGTLQLFRTQAQMDGIAKDVEVLQDYKVPFEVLDRAGFVKVEPALKLTQEKFVGALRLPGDETGDCFKFTNTLAKMAEALGVKFRYNTSIDGIEVSGGKVTGVRTSAGTLTADHYVTALGSFTPQLVKPIGIHIPVYPVKGYSITVDLDDAASQQAAPTVSLLDDETKLVTSRLGADRFRVAGTAEFNGINRDIRAERIRPLVNWVNQCFPGVNTRRVEPWAGLRPMMPNMLPRVGPGRQANVFYNTGHGHLGWTLSAITAHQLAGHVQAHFARPARSSTLAIQQQGEHHGSIRI